MTAARPELVETPSDPTATVAPEAAVASVTEVTRRSIPAAEPKGRTEHLGYSATTICTYPRATRQSRCPWS